MSGCRSITELTGQGILPGLVRNSRCVSLLLCVVTLLLGGCHTKNTVQAREQVDPMPLQQSKDALKCSPRDDSVHGVIETESRVFNLLNSDLVACSIEGGGLSVEPRWSVVASYNRADVYKGSQGFEFESKGETTLYFEKLLQRQSDPFERDAATSLTLFNRQAAATVNKVYRDWPVGMSSPASVTDTQLKEKSARVLKLQFARNDLKRSKDCNYPFCRVKVVLVQGKNPEPRWINMDPREPCKYKVDAGKQAKPSVSDSISMDCFYYVVVHLSGTSTNKATFDYRREYVGLHPHKKPDQSNDVVYLLLGFHLMQSDEPAWTWSTFWWTPSGRQDKVCVASGNLPCKDVCDTLQTAMPGGSAPRAVACEKPWSYYAMDHQKYDAAQVLAGDNPKPHFNPYIEDPESKSNCIYCHARALYHAHKLSDHSKDFTLAKELSKSADIKYAYMLPCFAIQQSIPRSRVPVGGDVNCADATPTHFLWSLARRLDER